MWHGRQAVLFNIEERHFYLFSMVLEPADMLYLAGLMIVSAFGLFWWTTIAGRLWCGYSCPQTVYTEIMLWIDHLVEGDRNKRLKLDKEPWHFHKIRIKALKYLIIFTLPRGRGLPLQAGLCRFANLCPPFSRARQAALRWALPLFTVS